MKGLLFGGPADGVELTFNPPPPPMLRAHITARDVTIVTDPAALVRDELVARYLLADGTGPVARYRWAPDETES